MRMKQAHYVLSWIMALAIIFGNVSPAAYTVLAQTDTETTYAIPLPEDEVTVKTVSVELPDTDPEEDGDRETRDTGEPEMPEQPDNRKAREA